jgi:hypothetical protein
VFPVLTVVALPGEIILYEVLAYKMMAICMVEIVL